MALSRVLKRSPLQCAHVGGMPVNEVLPPVLLGKDLLHPASVRTCAGNTGHGSFRPLKPAARLEVPTACLCALNERPLPAFVGQWTAPVSPGLVEFLGG